MSRPIPYQPALLRLLHGVTAMLVPLARLCQPANAAALIGLLLAVASGELMQEDWLRTGQLEQFPYHLHLLAWLLISGAVIWHVTAILRRGGPRLAGSMLQLNVRKNDAPLSWLGQQWRRG